MLEDYDNGVAVEDSPALRAYKAKKLNVISSEYLISDNNIVASKIDKVLADGSIIDVKRTSKTYIKSLEWQLSIYAYLFEKQNKGVKVPALYCAHFLFTGNTFNDLKIIPINRLPDEKIEKLLECEKNGLLYSDDSEEAEPNLSLAISEEEILTLRQKEGQIIAFEMSAKRLKEEVEQFHNRIKNYMETNNIKTMQGAKLKYTLVDAFTRKGIDSSSLEKEMPEIAEKYRKNTVVKSSLKVKIC
jgi:regulator of replication initiation timing